MVIFIGQACHTLQSLQLLQPMGWVVSFLLFSRSNEGSEGLSDHPDGTAGVGRAGDWNLPTDSNPRALTNIDQICYGQG